MVVKSQRDQGKWNDLGVAEVFGLLEESLSSVISSRTVMLDLELVRS